MRVFWAYVVDSTAEGYEKDTIIASENNEFPSKGWMSRSTIMNIKKFENTGYVDFLGLGRHDFKNRDDYENNFSKIAEIKYDEFKSKYLPIMNEIRKECGYPTVENKENY